MEEKKDLNDDQEREPSFAEMMERCDHDLEKKWLNPGEKVEGKIVKISDEWVFIDLSEKSEGCIDRKEFLDQEGSLTVSEGDVVTAYFLSSRDGEKLFTSKLGRSSISGEHLEEAFRNEVPLEGVIEKEIKGGYEVKITGGYRAFCPYSLSGLGRTDSGIDCQGKTLTFRIIEYEREGRTIVLSRREIVEEERRREKEELRKTLREGMTLAGKIASIRDFGIFVDLGSVQGLLPLSELGWGHVDVADCGLGPGDTIEVSLLKLDWDQDRITLSRKALLPDPWKTAAASYVPGSKHRGTVSRLAKFGAFVTLEPGVDGLIHISKLAGTKRIKHPSDVLTPGDHIDVIVEDVQEEGRRISLSPAAEYRDESNGDDAVENSAVARQEFRSMGTLGDLLKKKYPSRKS